MLFLLIGLGVLAVEADLRMLAAGLLVIPLVLLARFVSVSVSVLTLRRFRDFSPGAIRAQDRGGSRPTVRARGKQQG